MRTKRDTAAMIVLIVLAVLLIPVIVINLTLIIKGAVRSDVPPSVFGIAPMAVATGSMDGEADDSFADGSLIFVKILGDEDKQQLEKGDIVTYRTDGMFVTHRIIDMTLSDGAVVSVETKGDANNISDGAIPVENVVGICVGSIGGLGSFSMFLQTPVGILVLVGVPVAAYIAYDVIRITLARRKAKDEAPSETDKDEEIRRLRTLLEEKNAAPAENALSEDKESAAEEAGASESGATDDGSAAETAEKE